MSAKNYFDIEISLEDLLKEGCIEDYFYVRELEQRKLFITDGIEQCTVEHIVKNIMQYNRIDIDTPVEERTPILLYVASRGGDIDAGFELIDAIRQSKTPVYTINLGYAYSMGFLIMLAGHKRFGSVNSTYLMHDGSNYVWNSGAKAQDQMEFNKRFEQRIKAYVLDRTRVSEAEYDANLRVEWYLFADEAKEKGMIDYIIGVDADMDEIV